MFQARALTIKERRVLLLIRDSVAAPRISKTTGIPKSSVAAIIRKLENDDLIRRYKGHKYNILYELSDSAQDQLEKEGIPKISKFMIHRVGLVFKIREKRGELSRDPRISPVQNLWHPHPKDTRLSYAFLGKAGDLSVTVTVHPRSLVVQLNKGQRGVGLNKEDARDRAFQRCVNVRNQFIQLQRDFGCNLTVEDTGRSLYPKDKEHVSFFVQKGGEFDKGVTREGWWTDGSKDDKKAVEVETTYGNNEVTPIDAVLKTALEIPDMLTSTIDPLNQKMVRIEALLQGSMNPVQRESQLVSVIALLLDRLVAVEKKLDKIEKL